MREYEIWSENGKKPRLEGIFEAESFDDAVSQLIKAVPELKKKYKKESCYANRKAAIPYYIIHTIDGRKLRDNENDAKLI